MKATIPLLLALVAATAVPAPAVVVLTDCAGDPHLVANPGTDTTHLDVGAEDLVVRCPLQPLPGTSRIVIRAHDVTVEGPAGSISASGKTKAVDIRATGTFTALDTVIESTNGNAEMDVIAVGDMLFRGTQVFVGTPDAGGDLLTIECTGPGCMIEAAAGTLFTSRLMKILAVGDILMQTTTIRTHGPRDFITIRSSAGNVCLICDVIVCSGPEGDLVIDAWGRVDLPFADIQVAQHIRIAAGVGPGPAPVLADIDATGATIRNDFG